MNWMVQGLAGGALIGAAAVLLMALEGRIAGISGIVGGLMPPEPAADRSWRLAFVVGVVIGPVLVGVMTGLPTIGGPAVGAGGALLAGLCVGIGAGLGNGCTSGHGICGMGRLSRRSIVATLIFMATGVLTVFLTHHVF